MKVRDREHVKLRKMGREYTIVRTSADVADLTDVFTFNETSAWLMEHACEVSEFDEPTMAQWLVDGYSIDMETALRDVHATVQTWKEFGLIED